MSRPRFEQDQSDCNHFFCFNEANRDRLCLQSRPGWDVGGERPLPDPSSPSAFAPACDLPQGLLIPGNWSSRSSRVKGVRVWKKPGGDRWAPINELCCKPNCATCNSWDSRVPTGKDGGDNDLNQGHSGNYIDSGLVRTAKTVFPAQAGILVLV